jgi:hypothetical protein
MLLRPEEQSVEKPIASINMVLLILRECTKCKKAREINTQ